MNKKYLIDLNLILGAAVLLTGCPDDEPSTTTGIAGTSSDSGNSGTSGSSGLPGEAGDATMGEDADSTTGAADGSSGGTTTGGVDETGSSGTDETGSTSAGGSSSTGSAAMCGNDSVEGAEVCDGDDLDAQDCISQGFDAGTLACESNCSAFNESGCVMFECGNGIIEGLEVCDGLALGGADCISQGFEAGALSCADDCSAYDITSCFDFECGNDVIEGLEVCDGSALAGADCNSLGFDGGPLACLGDCTALDPSACGDFGGDCCADNGTPGCDDTACTAAVCAADSSCCDDQWDAACGALGNAEPLCFNLGASCFVPSLNQAAFNVGTSDYEFGFNSIPNIPIVNAPAGMDWTRWAMLHDGAAYRLYFLPQGAANQLHQFAFNVATGDYEYGFNSIPEIPIANAPGDIDPSSIAMLHDGSDYRLYFLSMAGDSVHQFAFNDATNEYEYGFNSIPEIDITGTPAGADFSGWGMLHDGTDFRLYAFETAAHDAIVQYSFNAATADYEFGLNSIPVIDINLVPGNSNTDDFGMLHDGSDFRFYYQTAP